MFLLKAITCRIVMQCTALPIDMYLCYRKGRVKIIPVLCKQYCWYYDRWYVSYKTDCSVMQVFQLLDIRYLRIW